MAPYVLGSIELSSRTFENAPEQPDPSKQGMKAMASSIARRKMGGKLIMVHLP
jgi:hypothetical protein